MRWGGELRQVIADNEAGVCRCSSVDNRVCVCFAVAAGQVIADNEAGLLFKNKRDRKAPPPSPSLPLSLSLLRRPTSRPSHRVGPGSCNFDRRGAVPSSRARPIRVTGRSLRSRPGNLKSAARRTGYGG